MISHEDLLAAIPQAIRSVDLAGFGPKSSGKVRDIYHHEGQRILVTTDRISAFDRILGHIPFRGQVLNQLSAWWFERTADIVAHHLVAVPDPNVTIAHEAETIPVEVVVRGYITGVTSTALWTLYSQGERQPYGIALPDGLKKNDPLPQPIITPTTKAANGGHDQRLTPQEVLDQGIVDAALWAQIEQAALALFQRGQELAHAGGLILVDTKYEFGLIDGQLALIDELHTPDSSRYWSIVSYEGEGEAQHFDKEFMRIWFAVQGYTGDGPPPDLPDELAGMVAGRYIMAYEKLTGDRFEPAEQPAQQRIERNLSAYYQSQ
ncbi:MAG: phosphoribosylaminoimidazolesuccinocarboxamide synthase [Chloroflexi bacterium]|nr:phosphoribosylaminoimidazolesuccinocarboxamide synthase [Chloroflexota bacterium]